MRRMLLLLAVAALLGTGMGLSHSSSATPETNTACCTVTCDPSDCEPKDCGPCPIR